MAWITDATLKSAIAGRLGLASSSSLPSHWDNLVPYANSFAYKKIRGVLFRRGFTAAQADAWDAREDWNTRFGVLYAMLEGAKRGEQYATDYLSRDYEQALKELETESIVINGAIVYASGANARVTWGDSETTSDRFLLDEPSGDGQFEVNDGTRL